MGSVSRKLRAHRSDILGQLWEETGLVWGVKATISLLGRVQLRVWLPSPGDNGRDLESKEFAS